MKSETILKKLENPPEVLRVATNKELSSLMPYSYNMCVHDNVLYLSTQGCLYYVDLSDDQSKSYKWEVNQYLPFRVRFGQSMTIVGNDIVFFGGVDDNQVYQNDLWVYSLENNKGSSNDKWGFILTSISERAFHAAVDAGNGNLLIYGGMSENGILGDLRLISLKEKTSKVILEPILRPLYKHSMIKLDDKICVLGGFKENQVNSDIELFNLENGEREVIETEYKNPDVDSVSLEYCFELLLVSGSKNKEKVINDMMMFHLGHKSWIPFFIPKSLDITPIYTFQQSNCIIVLDSSFSSIANFIVTSDNEFSRDKPEYISFLKRNLNYGTRVFHDLCSPTHRIMSEEKEKYKEMMNKFYGLLKSSQIQSDKNINVTLKCKREYETLKCICKYVSMFEKIIQENNEPSQNPEIFNLHSTILELYKQKKEYNYLTKDNEELDEYANKVEILSFLSQMKQYKPPKSNDDVKINNDLMNLSRQISDKIFITKNLTNKQQAEYKSKFQKYQESKKLILTKYDQIWQIDKNRTNIDKEINQIKLDYCNQFKEIIANKFNNI